MWDAALFIFALVLLGGVILLLMYLRYRHSPAVLWRARLLHHRAHLLARKAELSTPPATAAVARLRDELFARHLRTVPVSELAKQPGIGPATVEKLKNAGWESVADVRHARLESLPGLGTARGTELLAAVKAVIANARGRFDAGACPEGVEFRRRAAELTATDRELQHERARQVAAVEEAVAKVDALAVIAKDVSFWNNLFHQKVPGLTDAVLHAGLPSPDLAPRPPLRTGEGVVKAEALPHSSPRPVGAEQGVWGAVATHKEPPAPTGRGEEQQPTEPPFLPRLRAITRFGFLVAKGDGRVAKAERSVLRDHLGVVFASDAVALRFIDPQMEEADRLTLNETDVVAAVKEFPAADRRELLALAHRIASAAGQVSAKEQQLLARLQAALGEAVSPLPPPAPADPRHNPDLDAVFGAPPEAPPAPPPPTDLRYNPDLDAVFGV